MSDRRALRLLLVSALLLLFPVLGFIAGYEPKGQADLDVIFIEVLLILIYVGDVDR